MEFRAMQLASAFYRKNGYEIQDTSKHQPYDLVCRKGEKSFHVEVKGSTSKLRSLHVTRGEVKNARERPTELFVVHSIEVDTKSKTASGGTFERFPEWQPADEELTALAFDRLLPKSGKSGES